MKNKTIKTFAIIFIYSVLPIIVSNLFQSNQQTTNLQGKMAPSYFLSLQEKKYTSPLSNYNTSGKKFVYLTFDDGPNLNTLTILNILNSYGVQGSFFLLNDNVKKHPQIANLIVESGNTIGCHGVTHRVDLFYASKDSAVQEMKECQSTIYNITRIRSPLIRVPFGSYPYLTSQMKDRLEQEGFIYWDWNIDSNDWKMNNEKIILATIKNQLNNIKQKGHTPTILLHDKDVTANFLPSLIDYLLADGYTITGIKNNTHPVQFNRFLQPAY